MTPSASSWASVNVIVSIPRSRTDSFFGARSALQLPLELFNDYQGNQSAVIAALPGLRPGASINNGERVTSVALAGTQMAIKWTTQ
jgi:hypothetical protein